MIGTRLKRAREELGLTQGEVAERVGLHINQINRYENGVSSPSAIALASLSKELGKSMDYLSGLSDADQGHFQEPSLSSEEQRLIDAYRRGDLFTFLHLIITDENLHTLVLQFLLRERDTNDVKKAKSS